MTVAGFEAHLTVALAGRPAVYVLQVDRGADITPAAVEQLTARLTYLARVTRAPEPAGESVVKTVRTVAEACDTTLEAVAAEIGADAAALPRGDVDALAAVFALRLAGAPGSSG